MYSGFQTRTSLAVRPSTGTPLAVAYKPGFHLFGMTGDGDVIFLEKNSPDPSAYFDQLARMAEKMEDRMATLEKILDADHPKWKERV